MTRIFSTVLLICSLSVVSQQRLTLRECEDAFRQNNLQLLAARFDVSAAQAEVVQAKIWELPVVSGEVNLYNPNKKMLFDAGKYGQKAVGIEQLVYLGGKKKNEIRLAKTNAQIAELQFESLLNNLRLELRRSFYTIYFDERKIATLDAQLSRIESLQQAYEQQAAKGNVSLKDVVRLQSLVLSLKGDRLELVNGLTQERQNLALLTANFDPITPVVSEAETLSHYKNALFDANSLVASALQKNPDYLIAQKSIEAQQANLKLQKSLAVPDLTLGVMYDQNSGAFANQTNLTLGIPLPLWNKNKGNTAIAKAQVDQAKAESDFVTAGLKADISTAYAIWLEQRKQLDELRPSVIENLETVNQGIFRNFQMRNISLFEFTDFMESYNSSVLQINERYKQLVLSGETINRLTHSNTF